jgi:hypothetical protein
MGLQLADRPAGERRTHPTRALAGHCHDVVLLVLTEQAGAMARPPGVQASQPDLVKPWITSRTVSSSAATSRAIAGTVFQLDEANTIIARRYRIVLADPRRTIRSNC